MDALGSAHGRETWLVLMPCIASTWTRSSTGRVPMPCTYASWTTEREADHASCCKRIRRSGASQTSRDAVELFDRMLDTKLGQYPRLLRQLAGEVGAERPDVLMRAIA
jgi:hypothetical protein